MRDTMGKTIVIGIDGATWNIMRPLLDKKKLPNIDKIVSEGVSGNLSSTIPPVTGPAWISFATGKNPGKHGCYDFIRPVKSLSKTKVISTKDISSQCFYELIDQYGSKCTIINMPGSHPPRINETVITSLMTIGDEFVYPKDAIKVAPSLENYRIVPNMKLLADEHIYEYILDVLKLENNRFECAKELFKQKWDFFFVMFSGTDWIQHIKDKQYLTSPNGNNIYMNIDSYVGWFLNNMPSDSNLIIMSDHGFKSYDGIFYINEWLKQEGYLVTKTSAQSDESSHKFKDDFKKKSKGRMNVKIPTSLLKIFAHLNSKIPLYNYYCTIKRILPIDLSSNFTRNVPDLPKTIAFTTTEESRAIYINDKGRFMDGCVDVADVDNIAHEIATKLRQMMINGEKLFESVHLKNDIYSGERVIDAPDIILELDKYSISNNSYPNLYYHGHNRFTNNHDPNGVFLAYGNDIKSNITVGNARIIDLAPTILHMFGIPIPRDMDGRVLTEIFTDDSEMGGRRVVYENKTTVEITSRNVIADRVKKIKIMKNI